MSLRVVFMGSDAFAVPALAALLQSGHALPACVTQPDRPQGRGRAVRPCPVRAFAAESGLPVLAPEKIAGAGAELAALAPDVLVVAAYGQYIPRTIVSMARLGAINIHPSLLPRYRGAAPIQWAVAHGEKETGVTIIELAPRMDAGPILLQRRHPILSEDTAGTLEPGLARLGAELALEVLARLETGDAVRVPQDETQVTWARKLEKADGRLDWQLPAGVLHNRVRGFQPWPGTFCTVDGRRLVVWRTEVAPEQGAPGAILSLGGAGPLIACGKDALRLLEVQPEGKRAMSASDFLRGARIHTGDFAS